jgi:cytolysin (calcineurin-like family phosphatase)
MRRLRSALVLAGLLLAGLAFPLEPQRAFPVVTFFVASDSHFGAQGMSEVNRALVEQLNMLPGTDYPAEIGGQVDVPRGLLFLGDTTDNGALEEFAEFEQVYGLTGHDGLLRYPVYEAIGNHDINETWGVKPRVVARHGAVDYSFDWDDLHVVCLDMYPDAPTVAFLSRDLARVGRDHPVILYFHYSIEGYYSDNWDRAEKLAFARAIQGYNVLAIFHGHEHRMGHYSWQGHPVFRPGSPRHRSHHFLVVRVDAEKMTVAARNFDDRKWEETWIVPIRR